MLNPWFTLEAVPGLIATETDWRQMIGQQFTAFKALCLQPSLFRVQWVPCPEGCGCHHLVIQRHDGVGAVAVCRCNPTHCPDIPLTEADCTALEVNHERLGKALCKAFGFDPKHASLPVPNTFQFGSWSTDAVPAILTIQVQNSVFRRAVAELAALLRRPFILFAPTSDFLDAPAQSILENHRAGFFDLKTQVILTENGTLHPTRVPGELFARFTPEPKEIDSDVATRAFALVIKLDTERPLPPPSLVTVFRLYCVAGLSMAQTARECKTSKPTVVRRLKLLQARIGMHPSKLRRFSPHFAKLQEDLRDDRARRVRARSLLGDEEDGEK
jgi:hypothetical protein